jgi:hypothetical protein
LVRSDEYVPLTDFNPTENTPDEDKGSMKQNLDELFQKASSPTTKTHNDDISRFNDNLLSFISPSSKRLHKDIAENSPAKLCHHTKETLRESQKHMLESIQYILDYGKVDQNPEAAKVFYGLEKYVQKSKAETQKLLLLEKAKTPPPGKIKFAAFNDKKKNPEPRLRGPAG